MARQTDMVAYATQPQDVPQQVDFNFGVALERIDSWIDSLIRLLPNLVVAVVVLALFYGLGLLARRLIRRRLERREHQIAGIQCGYHDGRRQ